MWGNPEKVRKKSPKPGVFQGGPLISSDRSKQEDGAVRPSETVAPEELQEQFAALLARHHSALMGFLLSLVPHWPDAEDRYKTLVGQVKFDRAARLEYGSPDNAGVKLKPDGSGYVVEMRLRRYIPLEFAPGFRFRMDASVTLADPSGTRSVLRLPWHSHSNADTMVNDTYTEVQLRPRNWAEAVLE